MLRQPLSPLTTCDSHMCTPRIVCVGGELVMGVLSNISSITDLGGFDPVWLFLVVGGVMFILGFAGCIGALRENTFLLKFLTAGVLAFVFKDWIKDQLYFFINNNIRAYRDDIDLQNLIDFTQEYWQCCGAFGADDWNLNIYFNCTDSNASRERCGVPFSCCTKDPAEDVINTQCGYDARQKPEVDQQIVIYTKGCVPQFEKWLQDNLTIVAGIFIGIALLQIFGICLAQNLVAGDGGDKFCPQSLILTGVYQNVTYPGEQILVRGKTAGMFHSDDTFAHTELGSQLA
ncbi:hypothetical protein E5288_WYG011936 [Bos mutus]|uniref:Uncharacterized protein n=1 Tax=Bos mutus TaxID=72004 RepID=A0A6B0QWV4_9CETA|nr:hypothetical protein [Bos mutus]